MLTGSIPSCFGNMTALKQLYLFKNQLSGVVPSTLGLLTKLTEIGLEENNFNGTVSNQVCNTMLMSDVEFWADCGGSTPELSCPCCTVCCSAATCETM